MSPSAIEIGPASGPHVALEVKKNVEASPNPRASIRHEEYQYLDLIKEILEHGEHRPDR
jgi:thymidylate synthase